MRFEMRDESPSATGLLHEAAQYATTGSGQLADRIFQMAVNREAASDEYMCLAADAESKAHRVYAERGDVGEYQYWCRMARIHMSRAERFS
jgi:hypothetical protein